MAFIRKLVMGLCALFRKKQVEQDMDEELRAYLDAAVQQKMRDGMSPEQALRAARVEMGSMDAIKEEIRSAGWESNLEGLWQDLRYGARQLKRNPGFTAVVVLTLALGIGANTAVFTLTDAVMIRMLPVKNPQQLVLLGWVERASPFRITTSGYGFSDAQHRDVGASFAYPLIEQLRGQNHIFSSVFGFVPMGWSKESVNVSADGQADMVYGVMVTGGYFSGLGIVPVAGRLIIDADVKANAPKVVTISYSYWTRRFARSPSVVGKGIYINGVPFTIVGIAPPEFFGVQPGVAPDVWIPLMQQDRLFPWGMSASSGRELWTRQDRWWVMVMARLRPGVTEKQVLATASVPFLASAIAAANKDLKPAEAPELLLLPASRGLDTLREQFSQPLRVLTVVVGIVLLIACANIATLLLARASGRSREIGVRLALGASRSRLIRQLLTESILLSAMGGVLGLLLAQWGSHALLILIMRNASTFDLGRRPDWPVLSFCAGASMLAGILFGLAPALRATRTDFAPTLKGSAVGPATLGGQVRLGKTLVTVQVALTLLLLVGATLFVRTLTNLENLNLGFNPHNVLIFAIDPAKSGYEGDRILNLCDNVRRRLEAVPGVRATTFSELALLTGWVNNGPVAIEGYQAKPNRDMEADWDSVGPGFFETMGIRLLSGRPIDSRDTPTSPWVAVVNQAMARYFFGEGSPIGRRFSIGEKLDPAKLYEIVGVVENAKYGGLRSDPRMFYIPNTQSASALGRTYFEVRTAGDPGAFIAPIRSAIRQVDSTLGLEDVKTQTQQIAENLTEERMFAELCSLFGIVALALAAVGLYGLMAYSVAQRTNEIGIRMALGAQRKQVLYMVLGQSVGWVVAGVGTGLLAAIPTTRLIATELYGLKPTDPLTLGFAAFFLLAVASLAAYLPAHRATKVDPMVALRYE